jgi:hypothetical protein
MEQIAQDKWLEVLAGHDIHKEIIKYVDTVSDIACMRRTCKKINSMINDKYAIYNHVLDSFNEFETLLNNCTIREKYPKPSRILFEREVVFRKKKGKIVSIKESKYDNTDFSVSLAPTKSVFVKYDSYPRPMYIDITYRGPVVCRIQYKDGLAIHQQIRYHSELQYCWIHIVSHGSDGVFITNERFKEGCYFDNGKHTCFFFREPWISIREIEENIERTYHGHVKIEEMLKRNAQKREEKKGKRRKRQKKNH